MSDYCRLCAELKDPCEIITSIDNVEQSMEQKLRVCCQWTTEDIEQQLPHSVCAICSDELDKCWLFSQSVQLAQQKLLEIFGELHFETKPSTLELVQIVDNSMEQTQNNFLPAMAFGIQINTTETTHNNVADESLRLDKEWRNSRNEAFTSKTNSKRRKRNANRLKRTSRKYAKTSESMEQQYQCPDCGKCFKRQYKLKRHQLTHTSEGLAECSLCHERFRFKYQLMQHIKSHPPSSIQPNLDSIQCNECGCSFNRSSDLKRHNLAHSTDYPFECEECGRRFRGQFNLKQHRLKHTNERPYECWLCHKVYKQTMSSKSHMKIHVLSWSKSGTCICELCGRSFSHMSFLTEHLSTALSKYVQWTAHSDQRPHKCDICGLGYKTKRLLGKHLITHTEFEHKCTQCDRAFRKKASLRVHMKSHTGVINKPMICDVCGKAFRKNYELTEHRRIHTGEKPFKCEHCDSNFRPMSNFYGHLRKKHGISVSARNREEQARATAMSTSMAASERPI